MKSSIPPGDGAWQSVREEPVDDPPALVHPGWRDAWPWLVHGTTRRGERGAPFDLGVFADGSPAVTVVTHWELLRGGTRMPRAVVARQVHGAAVRVALGGPPGLEVADSCDGHVTAEPGVLLGVTAADCVPVFLVEPGLRAVAVLHAGWRGVAAGVLEAGMRVLSERLTARAEGLHAHLGPAICGDCYEVGPEVLEALGMASSGTKGSLDLRAVLAARAEAAGVPRGRITISEHCTLCGDGLLFSHRGGDRERHVGYIGVRP